MLKRHDDLFHFPRSRTTTGRAKTRLTMVGPVLVTYGSLLLSLKTFLATSMRQGVASQWDEFVVYNYLSVTIANTFET